MQESYLTKQETVEFKKLYKKIFGVDLTLAQAEDQGTRLIMLIEAMQKFEPISLCGKDAVDQSVKGGKNE